MPQQLSRIPRLLSLLPLVLPLACSPADGPETEVGMLKPALHAAGGGGQIEFVDPFDPGRPYFHDFGTIRYGERARAVFTMVNSGDAPLTVLRAQADCACTRVSGIRLLNDEGPPTEGQANAKDGMLEVPPGGVFELEIQIDSTKTRANTEKLAIMRIVTDSLLDPYLTLELHMRAERLFEVFPATVNLKDVPQYGGKGETIQIFKRLVDKPARLLEVVEATPGLEASIESISEGTLPFWSLTVRLMEGAKKGGFRGKVVISHTDSSGKGDGGRLTVDVFASVVDAVILNPRSISFGAVENGKGAKIQASLEALLPGQRIAVEQSQLSGPSSEHLELEVKPLRPDSEGRATHFIVELRAKPTLPMGRIEAQLVLDLDDSTVPRIERKVDGFVR